MTRTHLYVAVICLVAGLSLFVLSTIRTPEKARSDTIRQLSEKKGWYHTPAHTVSGSEWSDYYLSTRPIDRGEIVKLTRFPHLINQWEGILYVRVMGDEQLKCMPQDSDCGRHMQIFSDVILFGDVDMIEEIRKTR